MRLALAAAAATITLSVSIPAAAAQQGPPSCNWGRLTAGAAAAGFDQGGHASDPSGDGHGPGTADEPRSGLANVVERGDLDATCQLIASLL
jgi:hypothetical protein